MSEARDVEVRSGATADGWSCEVTVRDAGSASRHVVAVRREDLDRLDPGALDPSDLVRRSFAFLLERERKESILASFELPVIGRYFPEYEEEIRRR
jgi:hypothetical protein